MLEEDNILPGPWLERPEPRHRFPLKALCTDAVNDATPAQLAAVAAILGVLAPDRPLLCSARDVHREGSNPITVLIGRLMSQERGLAPLTMDGGAE